VPVADYSLTAQALPDYAEVSPQTDLHAATTHTPASSSSRQQADASSSSPSSADTLQSYSPQESASLNMVHSHRRQEASSKDAQAQDEHHFGGAASERPQSSSSSSSPSSYSSPSSSQASDARHQDRRDSNADTSTSHANDSVGKRQPGGGGQARVGEGRGVYSFCMCPGGQIVPTTTNPEELCINGMSFRYDLMSKQSLSH